MALLKILNFDPVARVYIWKLEESEDQLLKNIELHPSDRQKFEQLNHPQKRREFLGLRHCLREHFGQNPPVFYLKNGKPYLDREEKISFSHTLGYSSVIISKQQEVGIDLELYRPEIRNIARKYMREEESVSIRNETDVEHLLTYWGAKEVMVKIIGDRRLDFRKELRVSPFAYQPWQKISGRIYKGGEEKPVRIFCQKVGELFVTLGWEMSW